MFKSFQILFSPLIVNAWKCMAELAGKWPEIWSKFKLWIFFLTAPIRVYFTERQQVPSHLSVGPLLTPIPFPAGHSLERLWLGLAGVGCDLR